MLETMRRKQNVNFSSLNLAYAASEPHEESLTLYASERQSVSSDGCRALGIVLVHIHVSSCCCPRSVGTGLVTRELSSNFIDFFKSWLGSSLLDLKSHIRFLIGSFLNFTNLMPVTLYIFSGKKSFISFLFHFPLFKEKVASN